MEYDKFYRPIYNKNVFLSKIEIQSCSTIPTELTKASSLRILIHSQIFVSCKWMMLCFVNSMFNVYQGHGLTCSKCRLGKSATVIHINGNESYNYTSRDAYLDFVKIQLRENFFTIYGFNVSSQHVTFVIKLISFFCRIDGMLLLYN